MLVKNLLAAFALTGLAVAMPTEDLEERDNYQQCSPSKAWCCKVAVPNLNLFFIKGTGKDCQKANQWDPRHCGDGKYKQDVNLCCSKNQIVVSFSSLLLLWKPKCLTEIGWQKCCLHRIGGIWNVLIRRIVMTEYLTYVTLLLIITRRKEMEEIHQF